MNEFNDFQDYSDGLIEAFNVLIQFFISAYPEEINFFCSLKVHLYEKHYLSYRQTHFILNQILKTEDSHFNRVLQFTIKDTIFKNLRCFNIEDQERIKQCYKFRKTCPNTSGLVSYYGVLKSMLD